MSLEVERLRNLSYEELLQFRDAQVNEVSGSSGMTYEIEIESFWDNPRKKTNLRVLVRLDAVVRGWRRRLKITDDFIIAPDGSFIGE
ncbi:MAG TPA: hypothetical protein VGS09_09135 [Actinomycetota bacterium]|nr:hypothetical protein [Actinomycetota bacterium]